MNHLRRIVIAIASLAVAVNASAERAWSIAGGTMSIRFHQGLLDSMGIGLGDGTKAEDDCSLCVLSYRVSSNSDLSTSAAGYDVVDNLSGSLTMDGNLILSTGQDRIELSNFRLIAAQPPALFTLKDDQGEALLWLDNVHARYDPVQRHVYYRNMDCRITPELARRIGRPELENMGLGAVDITLDVVPTTAGGDFTSAAVCPTNFGSVDVLLTDVSQLQMIDREVGVRVAMAPSASLKNIGTNDVFWYWAIAPVDFAGPLIGQHPYLVMQFYRIANTGIQQLGRSEVKHAFYATNVGTGTCCSVGGQTLRPGCADTYGTFNNTDQYFFGPRAELTAHSGQWESLGSHFDGVPEDNSRDHDHDTSTDEFEHMLIVAESDMQTTSHLYYIEVWYLVGGDTNIFNNIGYRRVAPRLTNGVWTFNFVGTNLNYGSAVNAWVSRTNAATGSTNTLLNTDDGHLQLATSTTNLGGGRYRYSYALMNLDFDRAIQAFSVPLTSGLSVSNTLFIDTDQDGSNNWSALIASNSITWYMPTNTPSNPVLWGTLFNFGFEANATPVDVLARLDIYSPGTNATLQLSALGAVVPTADLGISVTATPPTVVLNSNISYSLTVTNSGLSEASNVTVSSSLETNALGTLAFGGSSQWIVQVVFADTNYVAAITNTFSVTGSTTDLVTNNNSASPTTLTDHDGDGIPTGMEDVFTDVDGDGIPAYLDEEETFDMTGLDGGLGTTLRAISGAVYQLQYSTSLPPPQTWFDLGGAVTADGDSVSILDTNAAETQKYYRVLLDSLP